MLTSVPATPVNGLDSEPHHLRHGAALARGTFFNTVALLASNLKGIFALLIARLLGSQVLGTYSVAWAAIDIISKITTFGFETSATTYVARCEAAHDTAGSRRIMQTALTIGIGLSVVIAAAGFVFGAAIGALTGQPPELVRMTAVLLLALPGVALYRISNAVSRGMAAMHHDIYSRGLTESLGTPAALLLAIALGARARAPEFAVIAGTLASGAVAWWCARGLFPASRHGAGSAVELPALLRDSGAIAAYDFLNIGIMNLDVLMLGLFVGRAPGVTVGTVGVYAAAATMGGGLRKINQAFGPAFMTTLAWQMKLGHIAEAQATFAAVARWMLTVLLPAVAVFALAGGALMSIYGAAFVQGAAWLAIAGAASALNAFVGLGETILMVSRPRINFGNAVAAIVAGVLSHVLLIPRLGPLGAAISVLVPYTVYGVLRGVEITWLFDWHWPWRALAKPVAAALVGLMPALAVRLSTHGLAMQGVSAAVFLATYAATWRLIGLEPSDRALLDHLLRRPADAAPIAGTGP